MKGDFSRDSFDRRNHYSGVLMQEGRAQTDADTNEQGAILREAVRDVARDVFGAHGGPGVGCGFEIITAQRLARLTPEVRAARWFAIEPDSSRRAVLAAAVATGDAVIGAGRYYVDGVLAENERARLLTEQPGFARACPTTDDWNGDRPWLAFLDVWERHVTALEAPDIRDVALGGADTSTRAQIVWCVRILAADERDAPFAVEALLALPPLGTGRLRARTTTDCASTAAGGYRGTEDRLYRVEIHRGGRAGTGGGATFKWSRDNGAVAYPIRSVTDGEITLGELQRDGARSLAVGDWVEFSDDASVMRDEFGVLAQVVGIDRKTDAVALLLPGGGIIEDAVGNVDLARHPLLRRWDHAGRMEDGGALPIVERDDTPEGRAEGWVGFEEGVEVWFEGGGVYKAGDYWTIPARVTTRDVVWPQQRDADGRPEVDAAGAPVAALRCATGPRHRFAPLLLSRPGATPGEPELVDCRRRLRCAWLEDVDTAD